MRFFSQYFKINFFLLTIVAISTMVFYYFQTPNQASIEPVQAQTNTYYASPNGSGDGSASNPFQIADFWPLAGPGDTLYLLDGIYQGSNSMIQPPINYDNINKECISYGGGAEGNPITIKALNDGQVTIDGENQRRPVYLLCQNYFIIEGINAHSAYVSANEGASVIETAKSNYNIIRRVIAWDASPGNTVVIGLRGSYNLIEDCAAWGEGRKIFSASQSRLPGHNTFRRCFGMFKYYGGGSSKPVNVFQNQYNSHFTTIENSIATWDQTGCVDCNPDAFFSNGSQGGYGNKLLGNIAYTTLDQNVIAYRHFRTNGMDFTVENNLSIYEGSTGNNKDGFLFAETDCSNSGDTDGPGEYFTARKLTSVGAEIAAYNGCNFRGQFKAYDSVAINSLNYGFESPNYDDYVLAWNNTAGNFNGDVPANSWQEKPDFLGEVGHYLYAPGVSVLQGKAEDGTYIGADVWHRYQDGVLTNEILWPWPMNDRIRDALIESGYDDRGLDGRGGLDLTKTIFELAGGTMPDFDQQTCLLPDFNCDQKIDVADLTTLKNLWGQTDSSADFNQDSFINTQDFGIMMSKWGTY